MTLSGLCSVHEGERASLRGKIARQAKLTVTPSKLVFLRASRKSFSHNTSLYRKSDIVWLRWKCRILRATCFTASATVQMPSYVYPWNLEYSPPRRESYSSWYCSGVWRWNASNRMRIETQQACCLRVWRIPKSSEYTLSPPSIAPRHD